MTAGHAPDPAAVTDPGPIAMVADLPDLPSANTDPGVVVLTCANCGARMDERRCKLICDRGYFLPRSDYY
jgi:hypothetical protein